MKLLGILFVFFGYVLVYASVAAGGKFATEPWAGLFADAYTGAQIQGAVTTATQAATTAGQGIAQGASGTANNAVGNAVQNILAGIQSVTGGP